MSEKKETIRRFERRNTCFSTKVEEFSELDAPDWLTGKNTVPGSTMDDRWWWNDHVLKLEVGESLETDFSIIKRVA